MNAINLDENASEPSLPRDVSRFRKLAPVSKATIGPNATKTLRFLSTYELIATHQSLTPCDPAKLSTEGERQS